MKINMFIYNTIVIAILYMAYDITVIDMCDITSADELNNNDKFIYNMYIKIKIIGCFTGIECCAKILCCNLLNNSMNQ